MTGIPDRCETPGCDLLAAPGVRYCLACLSQIADGKRAVPALVEGDPFVRDDLAALVAYLTTENRRQAAVISTQQRTIRLLQEANDTMRKHLDSQSLMLYQADAEAAGLHQQLDGLRAQLQAYIDGAALPARRAGFGAADRAIRTKNGGVLAALRRLLGNGF